MIFKVAYKRGDRILIKVNKDGKDIWMECSENVFNWCKKTFTEGEEIDVTYTEKNGQYTTTRVCKKGSNNAPPAESYKKTTVENKTAPSKNNVSQQVGNMSYPREFMKSKNPEESKQIRALSILSSVTQAVQALAGHVDPNNIGDIIETLYDRFDKKLV